MIKNSDKVSVSISIILYVLSVFAVQTSWGASPNPGELSYTFDFTEPVITQIGDYDRVRIKGCDNWSVVGEPLLPVKGIAILIPEGKEAGDITYELGKEIIIPGNYYIEPEQKPFPLSKPELMVETLPDTAIYDSYETYPAKILSDKNPQIKNGYHILYLNLHPVRYIPAERELSYFKTVTVTISFISHKRLAGELRTRDLQSDREDVRRLILNPEIMESYESGLPRNNTFGMQAKTTPTRLEPLDTYSHVIITNDSLASSFSTLRDHRIAKGMSSTIVTTEWIYANYAGDDNQMRIRNFIRDYYQNKGTEYVLLGGYNGIIPARMLWVIAYDPDPGGPYEDYMPSDIYYGCLDGTFNYDGDGKWGEPNDGPGGSDVDLTFEVHIGRVCVENAGEVANVINKIISYENSEDDYLKKASMVGEHLGFGGLSEYAKGTMEQIRLGGTYDGYTTTGFISSSFITNLSDNLYDEDGAWSKDQLINLINNGVQITNHLGHANYTYCMKLYASQLSSLNNDKYFFGYSQGCMPGGFDTSNCWCEVITTMSKGAFAFVGNARYGFGLSNSTDGPAQRYNRPFWHALFEEGIREVGAMNSYSKEYNIYRIDGPCSRWTFYETNLFGDPATPIHDRIPEHNLPEGWRNFSPTDWTNKAESSVEVHDMESGLNVSSGKYQYSNDGGSSWNGSWLGASCTGESGTTEYQTVTASSIPFNNDSATQNKVKFKISDVAGNTGYSAAYNIKLDTTPPETVEDLGAMLGGRGDDIYLSWTAPEDVSSGSAFYTIRYSQEDITESNWSECSEIEGEPTPGAPGTEDSMTVSGLEVATTYFFGLKTTDKAGNVSELSNIASGITEPNPIAIITASLKPAFADESYSAFVQTLGGYEPFEFTITGGSLPAGFFLNSVTGEISGNSGLTQVGDYSFTVKVNDSWTPQNVDEEEITLTISVRDLNIVSNYLSDCRRGESYSWILSVSGGIGPYTWSIVSGDLPAGLILDPNTGEISGIAIGGAGVVCFTVRVTDTQTGLMVEEKELCLNVTDTVSPEDKYAWGENIGWLDFKTAEAGMTVGSNILSGFAWNDNVGWFCLGDGSPDSGNQYSNSNASDYGVNNDGSGNLSGYAWSENVGWIDFNPPELQVTIDSEGNFSGYAWSDNTGWIHFASESPVAYRVKTDPSPWSEINFQALDELVITTGEMLSAGYSLPEGKVREGYYLELEATGGIAPYSWSLISGALPDGLTLEVEGYITGCPAEEGEYSFTVKVSDLDSPASDAEKTFSMTVSPAPLTIATWTLPGAVVDDSYKRNLIAYFGKTPYSWSIISGALPKGLYLESDTGRIFGTPSYSSVGANSFTVKIEDFQSPADLDTKELSIEVTIADLEIVTESLPNATVGDQYSGSPGADGGVTPYFWSVSSGLLPEGLSLNSSSGEISGIPDFSSIGANSFTIKVTDSQVPSHEDERGLSIQVIEPDELIIFTDNLIDGVVGGSYSQTARAAGGTRPYSWAVISGNLPEGLSLDVSTGEIAGTPGYESAGTHNFTIRVGDSASPGAMDEKDLSITINYADLEIVTEMLPAGSVDAPYSESLQAQGGVPPYNWALASGTLPDGLILDGENGEIGGIPEYSSVGENSFRVRVTDSQSSLGSTEKDLGIYVNIDDLLIISMPPPEGTVSEIYSFTFAASGGVKPYNWSIQSGELPSGISIDPSIGIISGIPQEEETALFAVQVEDSQTVPDSVEECYSLTMSNPGTGNIDPFNKYSWSENSGWMNFRPDAGGVTVYEDHLEGWAKSDNIGWVHLEGEGYQVSKEVLGNLSGYGWNENVGWVDFNPAESQVTIDFEGNFAGFAWNDNIGWIHFASDSPVEYKVQTWWHPGITPTPTVPPTTPTPEPTLTPEIPPPPPTATPTPRYTVTPTPYLTPTPRYTPTPTPFSYQDWIAQYPGVGSETGERDDPDGDGWNNLAEYRFFVMSGRESDPSDSTSGGQALPLVSGWNLISITVDKCWYDGNQTGGEPFSIVTEYEDVAGSPPNWANVFASLGENYDLILNQSEGDSTYNREMPWISTLDYISPDQGFWIKMNNSDTLVLNGERIKTTGEEYPGLSLHAGDEYAGWSLIGFLPGSCFYTEGDGHEVETPSDFTGETGFASVSETLRAAFNMATAIWEQVERIQVIYPQPVGGVAYQKGLPDSFQSLKFKVTGYGLWIKMEESYAGGNIIYKEP